MADSVDWDEQPQVVKPLIVDLETLELETSWDGSNSQHLPYMPPQRKAGYLFHSLQEED